MVINVLGSHNQKYKCTHQFHVRIVLFCRYDEISQRILTDMEMENLLKNRRIYSQHAVSFIQTMDITIVRHLPRLLRVITNYIEISDAPEESARLNALEMLESTVAIAWIRMPNHCEKVFKTLIKLIYDISVDKGSTEQAVKDKLIEKATKNIILLKEAVPEQVRPWLEALKDANTNKLCQSVFCNILSDAK